MTDSLCFYSNVDLLMSTTEPVRVFAWPVLGLLFDGYTLHSGGPHRRGNQISAFLSTLKTGGVPCRHFSIIASFLHHTQN